MSTTTPKAYSYIRFSTPEQANGDSFRRQTELSNRYAEDHGLNLDTSLSLCDFGVSGFTGENRSKGALALFLKAVETGRVPAGSFLLVESLDRLSRDTMSERMSLFIGLINAGLTVVTLANGQSYSKSTINTDLSKLMLSLVVRSNRPDFIGVWADQHLSPRPIPIRALGLVVSLAGLWRKPRKQAIWGVILGAVGTLDLPTVFLPVLSGR